jgi:hypothetical protein
VLSLQRQYAPQNVSGRPFQLLHSRQSKHENVLQNHHEVCHIQSNMQLAEVSSRNRIICKSEALHLHHIAAEVRRLTPRSLLRT